MPRALLDTDIFSEVLKRTDSTVVARASAYYREQRRYTISTVTVQEMMRGLHRIGAERRIRHLMQTLAAVDVLPLETGSAITAGRIMADL